MIKTYWEDGGIDEESDFCYVVTSRHDKFTIDNINEAFHYATTHKIMTGDVWDWVRATYNPGEWTANSTDFYFKNEHDKTLFLIRWG